MKMVQASTLRRHIQDVCKLYLGRLDLEKGQQVFSTGCKDLVMPKWTHELVSKLLLR